MKLTKAQKKVLDQMVLNKQYTARKLGAHTNTIKSLEKRGLIWCVNQYMPGVFSGFRERQFVLVEDPEEK